MGETRLSEPPKKIDRLRGLMRAGDWRAALALAASFPRLGDDAAAIVRAHEAHAHPRFYQSLGRDVEALKSAGVEALQRKYGA